MSHSRRRADDPLTLRLKAAAAKSAPSQKRRAADDADDPRLDHGEVEMSYDDMGSSKKRPAEEAADDSHRNEEPSSGNDDAKSSGDVAMDSIATSECSHCQRTFNSRNLLFKHLYENHDADSQGDRLKSKRNNSDRRNHPTEHKGSVGDRRTCTDEIARPALYEDDARRHRAISKPSREQRASHGILKGIGMSIAGCAEVRPIMAIEDFKGHPSPILKTSEISEDELKWHNIGSGMFAKTFKQVSQLPLTSKGGPVACDVHRRIVRSLSSGKVIDDCIVDDVSDAILHRKIPAVEDVRVELVMKDALAMYSRKGSDVVELYSQPRIAQEAAIRRYGKTELIAGWSLDLTMRDPETDAPWDLSKPAVQKKVRRMVIDSKPFMLIGSPPCTAFSQLQGLNNHKRDPEVERRELAEACAHIAFCFEMYEVQRKAGRYFAHEHPSSASSWSRPEVLKMLLQEDVDLVEVDMCHFGMSISDERG